MSNQLKQSENIESQAAKNLPQFAEIVVPLGVRQTFTYSLPTSLQNLARLGSRLLVPFRNKQIVGYIVALHDELDEDLGFDASKIKDALELIDAEPLLTSQVLRLAQWIADYYATSWGEVLKAALPAGLNATIEQILTITNNGRDELFKLSGAKLNSPKAQILKVLSDKPEISMRELTKTFDAKTAKRGVRELEKLGWILVTSRALTAQAKPKKQKAVRLLPPENHANNADSNKKLTEAHEKTVQIIIESGGEIGFTDLIETANVSASIINTLEKRGLVQTFVREVRRDPLKNAKLPDDHNFDLTDGQNAVLKNIESAIETSDFKAFLLHGVTGSGKTEVYIRAMRHALEMDKSSLMLVPEIALTPIFSRRLRAHFGETVAILHSSLSTGERFDEWRRIKSGAARIVIGTRSAIFAPLENLGVIVVDEEHDGSYRQHEQPFYSARDAAVVRAKFADAVVILGSATPALESFHNANINKYELLTLPNRVGNRPMATAEIVDMREVFKIAGKDEIFSSQLLDAIAETHERGEQSIILLNRRGFSQFVLCRSCGESIKCPNCDVTLTFHRREGNLVCHYCNYSRRTPKICPKCDSKYIFFIGEGTEQIEDILKTKFPDLRIARIDRDTTIRKSLFEETLLDFADKKIDMLVGTQMLAKGHDFPNVTLVGVVSVDAGLALPDFRASEKTFQLITQVAGRAGRGELKGRVLIQTFYPEHYALKMACDQNYNAFFERESEFRRGLMYPPFVALAAFLIHHADYATGLETANLLKQYLENADKSRTCEILGVAPAPLARIKNEFRWHILIKAKNRKRLRETIDFALADATEKNLDMRSVNLEIDPLNLL